MSLINSAFNNWGGGAYCEQYAVSGLPPTAVPGCLMPDATGQLINTTCYEVRLGPPHPSSQLPPCLPHLSPAHRAMVAAALCDAELVQSVLQAPVFPVCSGNGGVEVRAPSLLNAPRFQISVKRRLCSYLNHLPLLQLPFGAPEYLGLGFIVFVALVFIEIFGVHSSPLQQPMMGTFTM